MCAVRNRNTIYTPSKTLIIPIHSSFMTVLNHLIKFYCLLQVFSPFLLRAAWFNLLSAHGFRLLWRHPPLGLNPDHRLERPPEVAILTPFGAKTSIIQLEVIPTKKKCNVVCGVANPEVFYGDHNLRQFLNRARS